MPDNKSQSLRLAWQKAKYPCLLGGYSLIALSAFLAASRFLEAELNRAFAPTDEAALAGSMAALNLADYTVLAQKLNLPATAPITPVVTPASATASTTAPTANQATSSEPAISASSTPAETVTTNQPAAADLALRIENSTKTSGLAGRLKEKLQESGFVRITTANASPARAATSLAVKKSLAGQPEIDNLKNILSQNYLVEEGLLPETAPYDILIVIGLK